MSRPEYLAPPEIVSNKQIIFSFIINLKQVYLKSLNRNLLNIFFSSIMKLKQGNTHKSNLNYIHYKQ